VSIALPFEDSRRLTGPNLYFAEPGAVLQPVGGGADDARCWQQWTQRVQQMRDALGWPQGPIVVRPHPGGATLALAAPVDQLFAATDVNEWAWAATLLDHCASSSDDGVAVLHAPGHPAAWDSESALQTLRHLAAAERQPALMALLQTAAARGVPALLDDDELSIGLGRGSRRWLLTAVPAVDEVPWAELHAIPTALVTGSNGKTTTVRLLAAMLRATGLHVGHCCTDGLFIDDRAIESGDWSGPAGARSVLRDPGVDAAVLETARGGLLRRGLALAHADVAAITNVSVEHFGEYGIHDLAGLAEVKCIVARALDSLGLLVLNADDALLRDVAAGVDVPIGWFSLDDAHPLLVASRAAGGSTCGVRDGRLCLCIGDKPHDLGSVVALPLAAGGHALYNIANMAAAALLATGLCVAVEKVREVLHAFGSNPSDNPGRLQRWQVGGLQVFMDYAHNPEGLRGLLQVASAARDGRGRLGLLLGQAGNRDDDAIRALARVAAEFAPARIVLKDIDGYLRGRAPGEVAELLRGELLRSGIPAESMVLQLRELAAAREALAWARPGDVLVLPVHALSARAEVIALLQRLQVENWQAGQPLP